MTPILPMDDNNTPLAGRELPFMAQKTVDLSGTTAGSTIDLFEATGTCMLSIFAVCSVSLVGASATVKVGVAGATTGLIASTTAENIDAGHIWKDSSPSPVDGIPATNIVHDKIIYLTCDTATITAGTLIFYCQYFPLLDDYILEAV